MRNDLVDSSLPRGSSPWNSSIHSLYLALGFFVIPVMTYLVKFHSPPVEIDDKFLSIEDLL
jgi:hypothetical protein